jgi:hypothetical protein
LTGDTTPRQTSGAAVCVRTNEKEKSENKIFPENALNERAFQAVLVGEFSCPHCWARWVGRWTGPKHLITCIACKKRMYDDEGNLIEVEWDE